MDSEELHKRLHPEEYNQSETTKKVKKYKLAIQIGLVAVFFLIVVGSCTVLRAPKVITGEPTACFKNDVCIDLIIAQTPEELEIGLSNYSSLPAGKGMLFVFNKAQIQRMWMKDMSFPIDIMWINDKDRIVHLEKHALPCTPEMTSCEIFEPNVNAKYVLETNDGFATDTNLFGSDKVVFTNIPK